MSERVRRVVDRIEDQQNSDDVIVEGMEDASPLDFLKAVYRDPRQPINRRLRAAIEAAPYLHPKLSATAVLTREDFAERLERAIARSGVAPKLIEVKHSQST